MHNTALASAAELSVRALSSGVIASVTAHGASALSFDYLGVDVSQRGRGLADAAIAAVCAHADEHQAVVWMQPDNGFGSDLRRLVPWYARHGFVPVAGLTPFTMRRHPEHAAHGSGDRLPPHFGEPLD